MSRFLIAAALLSLAGPAAAQNYFSGQGQPSLIDRHLFGSRSSAPEVETIACSRNVATREIFPENPGYVVLKFVPTTKNGEWEDGSCAIMLRRF